MKKSSIAILESRVDRINQITNSPATAYSKVESKFHANIGNYHLYLAHGVYALEKMVNESGGVDRIFTASSKGLLLHELDAFLKGIEVKIGM